MAADDAEYQLEPGAVAAQKFSITRKGYKKSEVADYLAQISRELRRLEAAVDAERLESNRELARFDDVSGTASSTGVVIDGAATDGDLRDARAEALAEAARAEAAEIIAGAKERADELVAEARVEAESVNSVAGQAAVEAEAQLAGQAETVRDKLRDEVRKARAAATEEADAILRKADDEAALIRAAAGDGDDSAVILDSERAETIAARILEDSEGRAEEAIAELERERTDLETRTAALRLVQDSLTDGLGAAREQLSEMVDSLDRVADLSTLDMDAIDATSAEPATSEVADPEDVAADLAEATSADGDDDVRAFVAGELIGEIDADAESDSDEGTVRLLPAISDTEADTAADRESTPPHSGSGDERGDARTVAAHWDDVADTPDDEQIDALFDRVVAQRHGDPLARAVARDDAIDMPAGDDPADDADGWGYLESEPEASGDERAETGVDQFEAPVGDDRAGAADADIASPVDVADDDDHVDDIDDVEAAGLGDGGLGEDSPESAPKVSGDRLTRLRAAFASLSGSDARDTKADNDDGGAGASRQAAAENPDETGAGSETSDPCDDADGDAAKAPADDLGAASIDADVAVSQRDRAIASAVPTLKRKIKRGLQDVENIVLDAQRSDREPEAGESQIAERLYGHLVPAVAEVVASGFRDAAEHVGVATNPADGIDADTYALDVVRASLSGWVEELSIRIDAHPESGAKEVRAARKDAAELAADLAGTAHAAGLLAAGRRLPKVAGYQLVSSSQSGAEHTETRVIDDDAVLTVARDGAAVALVAAS